MPDYGTEGLEGAEKVNEYLWFGYNIPDTPPAFLASECGDICEPAPPNRTPLGAKKLFSDVIKDSCKGKTDNILVPLSGGWDSRLLLSELCEHVERSRIQAVTFGVPGTLDFDLGIRFANLMGVDTQCINLSAMHLSWEDLVDAARISQGAVPLLSWPNSLLLRKASKESKSVFSGFIGDFVNGGHDREINASPQCGFFDAFATKRNYAAWEGLVSNGYRPQRKELSEGEVVEWLTTKQAMFIWYRVAGYTAPAILGSQMNGWVSKYNNPFDCERGIYTPFTDRRWARFWMTANQRDRNDQTLFFEMFKKYYPDAFAFPSKDRWGLSGGACCKRFLRRTQHRIRNGVHRIAPSLPVRSSLMDNYVDFQWYFRFRDDYIAVVVKAIDVLKQRDVVPWIALDCIWREHYRGKRDHAMALQVLVGLAAHLEANG